MVARNADSAGSGDGCGLAIFRQIDPSEPGRLGPAGDPATLRNRPAVDLLDIAGEVDRRRAADVGTNGEGVNRSAGIVEVADPLGVQAARDDDLHVTVAGLIEAGADL